MTILSARDGILIVLVILLSLGVLILAILLARAQRASGRSILEVQQVVEHRAQEQLVIWRAAEEPKIRQDAIAKSQNTVAGKAVEHFAPYHPDFHFNPRDARFLGSPIDFIVFDGLSDNRCERVVFVEVKANDSSMSSIQRKVREAIKDKRVAWQELRVKAAVDT